MTSAVETSGGRVEGRVVEGRAEAPVQQFRGIPFAAPPVGDLRFRPPQPAEPWAGTLEATRFGPQALQAPSQLETMFGGTPPPSSEDCLTLNIYTPATDGARRPVMVWIHGGAFLTGSGSTPWYNGTSFAAEHDIVVVTVNYRLGAFGFLHLDDIGGEAFGGSGNVGILDQVAALDWVRENIEAFGGDPNNVTVFGESAGAMSVGTLMGLPVAKGLFAKAIPQSGAAHNARPRDDADAIARDLLAALGLDATPAGAARLRELPAEAVLEAQNAVVAKHQAAGLAFTPVVDGIVLPEQPIDAIAAGSAAGVRVLIGTNDDEMKLFTALDPESSALDEARLIKRVAAAIGDAGRAAQLVTAYRSHRQGATAADIWADLQGDFVFRVPAIRLAEHQSARGDAVYSYLFKWPSPQFGGALGACHALEIPFVWNTLDTGMSQLFTGAVDDATRELATAMHGAWASFARSGTPSAPGLPAWPAYDEARRATMIFDTPCRVEDDPGGVDREAWAGLR
jgi:para-nitrobenzyl esterase